MQPPMLEKRHVYCRSIDYDTKSMIYGIKIMITFPVKIITHQEEIFWMLRLPKN